MKLFNWDDVEWCENGCKSTKTPETPSTKEISEFIRTKLKENPDNIKNLLKEFPEEEIQNYLRAKKIAKIKS